jgi:hypothetical protein
MIKNPTQKGKKIKKNLATQNYLKQFQTPINFDP